MEKVMEKLMENTKSAKEISEIIKANLSGRHHCGRHSILSPQRWRWSPILVEGEARVHRAAYSPH